MQTYKRINEDYLDKTDIDQESVSVLDDVRAELDEWIRDKDSKPLSFNPDVLPDHFYHVESKKHLSQIIRRMKRDYKMGGSLNWLDVTAITNMSFLFGRSIFNFDISRWDVSRVTDMDSMFLDCTFNGNISGWDVSRVENMDYMFCKSSFDKDISGWDVSSVTNYEGIFDNSSLRPEYRPHFNPQFAPRLTEDYLDRHDVELDDKISMHDEICSEIDRWIEEETPLSFDLHRLPDAFFPVNSKRKLQGLIKRCCHSFGSKCDLNWVDVSGLTDFSWLFCSSDRNFDGDISRWDVSNVTTMKCMFQQTSFNGVISKWNVSNVTDMSYMFASSMFNNVITGWDVSHVNNMASMFRDSVFNGDISKWDISNVVSMTGMFINSQFDRNISSWDLSGVKYKTDMFFNCPIRDEFKPHNRINEDFLDRHDLQLDDVSVMSDVRKELDKWLFADDWMEAMKKHPSFDP